MSKKRRPAAGGRTSRPRCSAVFMCGGKAVCRCQRPQGHRGANHVSDTVFTLEGGTVHKVRWPQNEQVRRDSAAPERKP